ncbi:ankyrin repeat-containing domain protein [Mycena polygramma]|nr:ankyrin repeat-containing domain protein [Mycena polygramma]
MFAEGMPARAYTRQGPLQNATPLDIAARNGHMDVVALLATIPSPAVPVPTLGGGSDVLDGAETHRQQSVIAGNTEICKYLISEGADVNFFGKPQFHIAPPLYYASNLATVQLLLASGADPNIHPADHIPLLHAASTSTLEVVQALLDGGADINGPHSHSLLASCRTVGILRCFLECGADPNAAGWGGQIPLHRACEIGDTEFAKASVLLLLQFGAGPVDKLDVRGTSPVDIAMDRYDLDKVVEILEPLVQNSDIKMKITLWRESREPFPVDGSEW